MFFWLIFGPQEPKENKIETEKGGIRGGGNPI